MRRARTIAANQKTCARSSRTRRRSTPRDAASTTIYGGSATRSRGSIAISSSHENGVKAIGIVGSDVYDKLLILQALRSRFKDKIFFTTDLDARYLHADQKEWARNLVIASNFDLSLRPALQQSTLPFRDGYQTATYLAALMALEGKPLDYWSGKMKDWLRPQIFEIGRTEAVHLASPSVPDLTKWIKSKYSDGSAPPAEDAKCDDHWAACRTSSRSGRREACRLNTYWRLSP